MSKDNLRTTKSSNEQTTKKVPMKTKGRSFCCSMFIYTLVFVSGVVVATILPDLAGHHFIQPYGKEYGLMAEQIFKDLPKYMQNLREKAIVLSNDLVDRVWDLKTELERRVENMNNNKEEKIKTKTVTQRPTIKKDQTHNKKKAAPTANDRPPQTNEF
ncbi:unnamed protein product [Rotaria sp. Silwood1]|nr:unnamed protein product [Rotaria sp. Silwood1]CAF1475408.1 unnamed protein product [Rotaria sp. Silwood1]CAF3547356.1 unnamed protein product [Rotaria sp. Silwood1]CAF4817983.1 unnamed protein product [Rotaria sp. Silwood1]